ncbi:MAG: hypothetical protein WB779_08920 [Ignavibacteriaceae bacterium]|jgi:hypothetical protein
MKKITRVFKWAVIITLFGFTETQVDHILPKSKPDNKTNAIMAYETSANDNELAIVSRNINKADYISNKVGKIIQSSMKDASEKYHLPIILLYAIFKVESDYMYWINHPEVNVRVHRKRIITNAIGLGGVMWCFWGDSLIAHHIAETKSDLYLPDVNVMASAYILRTLINDEALNNPRLSKTNILNNVIRRYYGEYDRTYYKKMQKFISELWMEQVATLLMNDIANNSSSQ